MDCGWWAEGLITSPPSNSATYAPDGPGVCASSDSSEICALLPGNSLLAHSSDASSGFAYASCASVSGRVPVLDRALRLYKSTAPMRRRITTSATAMDMPALAPVLSEEVEEEEEEEEVVVLLGGSACVDVVVVVLVVEGALDSRI